MTATPYRSGVQGQALTVNFQLYGGTGLNVFHLALIDPVTNTEIGSLGSTVPSLPGGISIRADADRCTESVEFIVKDAAGQTLIQRTENIAPYALLGDRSRTFYNPWFPEPGEYSLEVTAYSERNASGLEGSKRIVQFTVLENTTIPSEPTVELYPNPSYDNDVIHISLKHFDNETTTIRLLDGQGSIVRYLETSQSKFDLNIEDIKPGYYILEVLSTQGILRTPVIRN